MHSAAQVQSDSPVFGDHEAMQLAIAEARLAEASGEVPVGCIIVRDGIVLARGRNRVITSSDPTAHAEIVALRAAGLARGNYRLAGCDLYCTLEPCAMCAGAILHARIRRLIYAAPDPKAGACGSVLSVLNHPQLNHRVEVAAGLLAEECGDMLTQFFRLRRGLPSQTIAAANDLSTSANPSTPSAERIHTA